MNKEKIPAEKLKQMNVMDFSKPASDFSKYTFWHYTSMDKAEKILRGHCFRCSNLGKLNDKNEVLKHEKNGEYIHVLCFCNSNTEKIPMWYLYAGVTGQGMSIGITPARMKKFIMSVHKVKGLTNLNGEKREKELIRDRDFDIDYGWAFYRNRLKDENAHVNSIFYRNQWVSVMDPVYFEEDNFFIKDYPWEYEREFRIVIINKTDEIFDQVEIAFSDEMEKSMKLKLAPEFDEKNFEKAESDFGKYVYSHLKKVERSNLPIQMDIMQNNKREIIQSLPTLMEDKAFSEEVIQLIYRLQIGE